MGLKPQQEADPNLQRLLNGDPTVIEEMPNEIDRDTECAMEIERQLRELGGNAKNGGTCLPSGGNFDSLYLREIKKRIISMKIATIDIIEFGMFLRNPCGTNF